MMVMLYLAGRGCCKTVPFKWDVEYIFASPDGEESMVMGINGGFPGPAIRVKVGDIVKVDVTNKLYTEGVVIHWHGIRMKDTPWADGTASISQCPIAPGETFTYRFVVDKGHYGMQRSAGLYGSLIVEEESEKEPFRYDGEFSLLLSDWWHKSAHEQETGLSSSPMRWINEPQSLLVNGMGQFGCSLAPQVEGAQPLPKCEGEKWKPIVLEVEEGKTYRLRVASTTALASLNLAIQGFTMKVVEADGNYVEQIEVDNLDIYSGESYSVLLTKKPEPNPPKETQYYYLSVRVRGRNPKTPPALALVKYIPTSSHRLSDPPLPNFHPPEKPVWNDYATSRSNAEKIKGLKQRTQDPPPSDTSLPVRRIILEGTQIKIAGGYTKWAINNIVLSLPPTPC